MTEDFCIQRISKNWIYAYLALTIINLLCLVSFVIVGAVVSDWSLIYGWLLTIPSNYIIIYFSYLSTDKALQFFAKNKIIGWKAGLIYGSAYTLKFAMFILPFLIAWIVNINVKDLDPINMYSILGCMLIYPTIIVLIQVLYVYIPVKKQNKKDKKKTNE